MRAAETMRELIGFEVRLSTGVVMRKYILIFAGLFVFACGATVWADDTQEKDFIEASIFGGMAMPIGGINNWGGDTLGAKTGFDVGFDVGYFMTADLVLGVTFDYSQFGIDNPNQAGTLHHRLYNPAVYGKYYFFSESKLAPYLKVQAGVDNPKFATLVTDNSQFKYRELSYKPAFAIGGGAGVFLYTSDVSGFFVEANLHHAFVKNAEGTYQNETLKFGTNSTVFNVHVGLAMFFGSGK
jgi:hypothetical protein